MGSEFLLVPVLNFFLLVALQQSLPQKAAPKTIPVILIEYYENVHGMTKDYIVISLVLLHEAKCSPNDPLS